MDSTVILKYFRRCGLLDKDFNVVQESCLDEDPFRDLDPSMPAQEMQDPELLDLIQKTCGEDGCSYNKDVDIPTCFDLDDVNWQERFFQELGPRSKQHCGEDEKDQDESDVEVADPQSSETEHTSSIKTYIYALIAIEDLNLFLQNKGHATEANEVMKFSNQVTSLYCSKPSSSRQTTLFECFNH